MDEILTWDRRGYPPELERIRRRVRLGWWNQLEVRRGWWQLLARLDATLDRIDPGYTLTGVAAKNGNLRFHAEPHHESSMFDEALWAGLLEASRTCEVCASTGERRDDVARVLCADHARPLIDAELDFLRSSGTPSAASAETRHTVKRRRRSSTRSNGPTSTRRPRKGVGGG